MMKKRLLSVLLMLCLAFSLIATTAMTVNAALTASPSRTSFVMNGKPVSVTQAYNVSNANYLNSAARRHRASESATRA
jgi:P pilus assembly chaperone PapD